MKLDLQQLQDMLELFNELYKQADSEATKSILEHAITKTKAEIQSIRKEELSND